MPPRRVTWKDAVADVEADEAEHRFVVGRRVGVGVRTRLGGGEADRPVAYQPTHRPYRRVGDGGERLGVGVNGVSDIHARTFRGFGDKSPPARRRYGPSQRRIRG